MNLIGESGCYWLRKELVDRATRTKLAVTADSSDKDPEDNFQE
jgi:hypothetical protein